MSTLLLRLAGPMQSWGADSKYNYRRTNREPTKSGVLGLLAAALGCRRDDVQALQELSTLRFGVRVDLEGTALQDFQMVHGKKSKDDTLTYRDYLCDAIFVAGLEGSRELLERLQKAVRNPVYPLFLGRRSCPPVGPICLGIAEEPLEAALQTVPWQLPHWRRRSAAKKIRMVLETEHSYAALRDVPISFSPIKREYGYRNIREVWMTVPDAYAAEHDPMAEL